MGASIFCSCRPMRDFFQRHGKTLTSAMAPKLVVIDLSDGGAYVDAPPGGPKAKAPPARPTRAPRPAAPLPPRAVALARPPYWRLRPEVIGARRPVGARPPTPKAGVPNTPPKAIAPTTPPKKVAAPKAPVKVQAPAGIGPPPCNMGAS